MDKSLIAILKEFGIETERELDTALKKSSFSLGIMAAGTLASLPSGNMNGEPENA